MSNGMYVSMQALENTLDIYMAGSVHYHRAASRPQVPKKPIALDIMLDRLFSPKQKELIFKRRDGNSFTKTEREYYSRIVRKKLEAIASDELGELAKKLTTK